MASVFPDRGASAGRLGGQRNERQAGSRVTPLMQYVPVRLAAAAATAMRGREGGGGGRNRVMAYPSLSGTPPPTPPPPPKEVDDINKKLIILPPASSRGLARAIHCSAHSPPPHTSHSPRPHKIMGWAVGERTADSEVCERERERGGG